MPQRTTIELQGGTDFPTKEKIERLLRNVAGFQKVHEVQGRTRVIVIHDLGSGDQIGISPRFFSMGIFQIFILLH